MPSTTSATSPISDVSPSRMAPPPNSDRARHNRVGLINQGATCYLNSLLQVLYHLPYFRSSVYRCVGDGASAEEAETSKIPAALQELFFQLQECNHAPRTEALTRSFGWSEHEVLQQHDIHELLTLLRDELENRMKGTPSQGAINKLFEGTVENVITTLDGTYTSRRPEVFSDIQLEVAGHKSLMASLRSLVKKDQLTGDNKYKVEEEGKPAVFKDAEKGLTYTRFPPVLCFHLKRFEMDMMSPNLDMKKINDRFEFTTTLDLRELEQRVEVGGAGDTPTTTEGSGAAGKAAAVKPEDDNDTPNNAPIPPKKEIVSDDDTAAIINGGGTPLPPPLSPEEDFTAEKELAAIPPIYDLHSIIVHKGSVHNGHYYCYVREVPLKEQQKQEEKKEDSDNVGGEKKPDDANNASASITPAGSPKGASVTSSNKHVDPLAAAGGGDEADGAAGKSVTSAKDASITSSASPITIAKNNASTTSATGATTDYDFTAGQWYEFDDDHVRAVAEADAVMGNFGGRIGGSSNMYGSISGGGTLANNNAYMLTYIRRGYWGTVMRPTPTDEIPQRVKDEFRRVMTEEDARRRALLEERKRCYISVVDDSHIADHVRRMGVDLYASSSRGADAEYELVPGSFDSRSSASPKSHTLIMQKQDLFAKLYDQLQDVYGYDKQQIRLRLWDYHFEQAPRTSYRPSTELVSYDDCQGTIENVLIAAGAPEALLAAGSAATATTRAALPKALKILLYVEQQRFIPIAPPSLPQVEYSLKNAGTPIGGNKKKGSQQQSSPNAASPDDASTPPPPQYDGSYSLNLLTDPSFIAEVATSTQHTETHPRATIHAGKAHIFAMRDAKPQLTMAFSRPRILKGIVMRFTVAKNASPINYMFVVEGYATLDQYRDSVQKKQGSTFSWRFAPQTAKLPSTASYGQLLHLYPDYDKSPAARTTAVSVVVISVMPNSPYTPMTYLNISAIYADEEAEVEVLKLAATAGSKNAASPKSGGDDEATNAAAGVDETADKEEGSPTAVALNKALTQYRPPTLTKDPILPAARPSSILLMVKGYTATPANGEHLRYLGPLLVEDREPLIAYADAFLFMMGVSVDRVTQSQRAEYTASIRFTEEQKPNAICAIDPYTPVNCLNLLQGNIIIVELSPRFVSSLCRAPTVFTFWEGFRHRVFVNVRHRADPTEPLFQCPMDLRWQYHQVCECIAARAAAFLVNGGGGGSNNNTSAAAITGGDGNTPATATEDPATASTSAGNSPHHPTNDTTTTNKPLSLSQATSPNRDKIHEALMTATATTVMVSPKSKGGGVGGLAGSPQQAKATITTTPQPTVPEKAVTIADRIALYSCADTYITTMCAADPIKCTSREGETLDTILRALGGRYRATDIFFDILDQPRIEVEQQVKLRAVIANEFGDVVTDEVQITLSAGAAPPDLVGAIFTSALSLKSVKEDEGRYNALAALRKCGEAFCLVGTRDNRVVSFLDNMLWLGDALNDDEDDDDDDDTFATANSSGDDDGSSPKKLSCSTDDEDGFRRDDTDDSASSSSPKTATTAKKQAKSDSKLSRAELRKQRLAIYTENTRPLDPSAFTSEVVYQLRPITLLPKGTFKSSRYTTPVKYLRMYVGFCDCPLMQYTHQAPLFNTPIVITITDRDTLTDVWDHLRAKNPTLIKDAREAPQKGDGLCIKLVMYTDQALSFNEWDRTPVNDYFTHTMNKSIYKPMLCINRSRPKNSQMGNGRYGLGPEPKLRLGGGGGATKKQEGSGGDKNASVTSPAAV